MNEEEQSKEIIKAIDDAMMGLGAVSIGGFSSIDCWDVFVRFHNFSA